MTFYRYRTVPPSPPAVSATYPTYLRPVLGTVGYG